MNALKYVIFVTILCIACSIITEKVDNGGNLGEYTETVQQYQSSGEPVIIDYKCLSACVIKLSSGPGLRVSKKAIFGVHEARFNDRDYNESKRFGRGTEIYKENIPECAVKLFESRHAFDSGDITMFTGEEVLKACPQIKEYIEK